MLTIITFFYSNEPARRYLMDDPTYDQNMCFYFPDELNL